MSMRPEDRLRDAVARLAKTRETARETAERIARDRRIREEAGRGQASPSPSPPPAR